MRKEKKPSNQNNFAHNKKIQKLKLHSREESKSLREVELKELCIAPLVLLHLYTFSFPTQYESVLDIKTQSQSA